MSSKFKFWYAGFSNSQQHSLAAKSKTPFGKPHKILGEITLRGIGGTASISSRSFTGLRSNDVVADSISRIRNGYFRSFEKILLIDSKQTRELLDAFTQAGYIYTWKVQKNEMEHHCNPVPGQVEDIKILNFDLEDSLRQVKHDRGKAAINREGEASNAARPLEVTLKYFKNIPAIRGIQQISRPGNRTYISVKRILKYSVEQNWGDNKTLFLSTNAGVLNHREILSGTISKSSNAEISSFVPQTPQSTESGEALCLVW